jgi:hypothetical protein
MRLFILIKNIDQIFFGKSTNMQLEKRLLEIPKTLL